MKVINLMRTMKVECPLDLEELHRRHGGKLFHGRPEMLLLRLKNGKNVQLFRGGTVQILGAIPQQEAERMRHEILQRLCLSMRAPLAISNMVVTAQLKNLRFQKIAKSSRDIFYETELFPAALITKWLPAHVAVFHTGKVVITGVKSVSHYLTLLNSLKVYFSQK